MKNSFPLYIHIPFCRSKCTYCDFFSIPSDYSQAIPDSYIDALKADLAYRCSVYKPDSWKTVYIGGGTPSLLLPEQLRDLFSFIREAVPGGIADDAEVTIEANPADINRDFLDCIADVGVNRLSVGIQCCSQKVLSFLGRRSDAETVSDALDCIGKYWKCGKDRRFSADLIAGLPFLSDEDFVEGVDRIIGSGADHVSLYSLMVEEGTPLWEQVRCGDAPCTDEDAERQWFLGKDQLEKAGIMQYEVSNFARPGFESRHNTAYWHMEDFIGIGAGASGTVGCERWTGVQSVPEYTAGWGAASEVSGSVRSVGEVRVCGKSAPCGNAACEVPRQAVPEELEKLDEATREYEFLMMGFRLRSGVSAAEYKKRFGKELSDRIGAEKGLFADWEKQGLAVRHEKEGDTFYALTAAGLMLLNRFLTEL
ncbi:MAG: radical SAM family heme chaperone HemW [Spirochaetaceae bacterium]|nr:radical SAM family heme chaperone HemW [Spirochaetaceae bacterium]